ncbi:MAG: hypothetical protein IPK83_05120 [Planctomycetes bacterium]|nr:hypothetical protein [Planctomycetota bacterium]
MHMIMDIGRHSLIAGHQLIRDSIGDTAAFCIYVAMVAMTLALGIAHGRMKRKSGLIRK